jgi:hypothetical protein
MLNDETKKKNQSEKKKKLESTKLTRQTRGLSYKLWITS